MSDLTDFLLVRIDEDEAQAARRAMVAAEAKRRIVELHGRSHECSQYDHNGDIDNCTWVTADDDCSTLHLLALPYAEHPDYQPVWALTD